MVVLLWCCGELNHHYSSFHYFIAFLLQSVSTAFIMKTTTTSSSRRTFLVVLLVLAVTRTTSSFVVQAFAPSSSLPQKTVVSLKLHSHPPTNNNYNDNNVNMEGTVSRRNAVKAAAMLFVGTSSLTMIMKGPMTVAYAAETALDFSLPTYDTNMAGFGDGKEAILNTKGSADRTDPGANEREKQEDAMRKAEEARLAQKAKKLAERKAREDEDRRRAAEKKARDAERLKNIWNS